MLKGREKGKTKVIKINLSLFVKEGENTTTLAGTIVIN